MKNCRFLVIFGVILALLCGIVPVSAYEDSYEILTHTYTEIFQCYSDKGSTSIGHPVTIYVSTALSQLIHIGDCQYVIAQCPSTAIHNYNSLPDTFQSDFILTSGGSGNYGSGTFGYFKYKVGSTDYFQMYWDFDSYTHPEILERELVFSKTVSSTTFPQIRAQLSSFATGQISEKTGYFFIACYRIGGSEYSPSRDIKFYPSIDTNWQNALKFNYVQTGYPYVNITIERTFPGYLTASSSYVTFGDTTYIDIASTSDSTYYVYESVFPVDVSIYEALGDVWYNRTFGLPPTPTPTPTPTPIPEPELTYPVTINFRHKHDYSLVTDVYYLIGDLKPSPGYPYGKTLYSGWSDTGTINIELEHRSMDDPNFPQQYRIVGKKYGYYDGEIVVSHLTAPYTFNVIMEDSSITPTVDTNFIEFRIQERFSDSYINEAILTIYDYESGVEVYNETVTGGIVNVRLNQTDTGYPYPHYKVNVYSEGYADFTEYILALYQDGIMRCRLTKVTTPLDPGNVILHVYTVRLDSNDNVINIPNVKVTVGGIEKVTNSAGYTWFEVPKNSTQMYTAEHPQYAVMSGSVLVEEGERFLHIWMQPPDVGVTPTPTFVTPTPTPDYSTPTGPIDAVYNLFSMLGIPTLFIGFILTALIAIGCMIFAENFAEGTGLYAGILGVLIGAGMGLIPLWIIIAFVFIGGIFYMKVMRGDG